jgi:PIN domain nuclease of toxin-antitoxin system
MSAVLADTHSILWFLFEPGNLTPAADAALTAAFRSGARIFVSTISPVEVRYLVEKGRLPAHYLDDLLAVIADPLTPIADRDVDMAVARATEHIPRGIVPELPDRIIAATALVHSLPLVTADTRLRAAPIPTIW